MPISIFETPEFVGNLRKYLPGDPKFPGLIVELTEDEVVSDPDLAHEVAIQLKLYNIGVAIDDFGSGHATLDQAQVLPFTELKIDRSKVDGCSRAEPVSGVPADRRTGASIGHDRGGRGDRTGGRSCRAGRDAMRRRPGRDLRLPMEREEFKQWVARA
jgi:hypothetical protein